MKRSTFKRPVLERARTVHRPIPEHLRRASISSTVGQSFRPAPKPEAQRSRALLDMARDRPCLLLVPGVHRHSPDTTVACHSNQGIHGKGERRKADDHYSVWGCFHCHTWLDQGPAPEAEKTAAFDAALARQLVEWARVAADPTEPERFRRAARWALELHEKATA